MTDLTPQQRNRTDWFFNTLKLKSINANKGTLNCGHCALRLDDYLRHGSAVGNLNPVPKNCAKLFSTPVFKTKDGKQTNVIRTSSTSDPRILDRCAHPGLSDQTLMRYDFTSDERGENPILDLTYEGQQQETEKASIRLIKVKTQDQNDLMEILRQLPRTSSKNAYLDNTAFGFIYRTHASNAKIAHITNFFVDTDDTVYFIDAQDATIRLELDLNKYQSDVFFVPSKPEEGYQIKKENIVHHRPEYPVLIKQEPNNLTDNTIVINNDENINNKRKSAEDQDNSIQTPEPKKTKTTALSKIDVFIEQVMALAKEQNSAGINDLMKKTGYSLNVIGSSQVNVISLLASQRERMVCEFLVQHHGATIINSAFGAALGGHQDLAEYFLLKLEESKRDYNGIAGNAAHGGHKDLTEYFLSKLEESKRNYNGVAGAAAKGGHQELANFYFEKAKAMELVNLRRQIQEKNIKIIHLTEQNKQKDLTIAQLKQQIASPQNIMPNVNNFIAQQQQQLIAFQKQMQAFQQSVRLQQNITPFVNNQGPNTPPILRINNAPTYTPQVTQLKNNVLTLPSSEIRQPLQYTQQIRYMPSQPNNGQGGSISSNPNNKPS